MSSRQHPVSGADAHYSVYGVIDSEGNRYGYVRAWTVEQFAKWRIRRMPSGALPPWRDGRVRDEAIAGEDGRVHGEFECRWWIWPPRHVEPRAAVSSLQGALRFIQGAIETREFCS